MYFVDNGSAVPVMPQVKPVSSATPQFFTEGGNGTPPTYPGPDWFNIFQLELLNVLKEAQINPDKANHTQLVTAMKKLFLDASSNGSDIPDKAAFLSNLQLGESTFGAQNCVVFDKAGVSTWNIPDIVKKGRRVRVRVVGGGGSGGYPAINTTNPAGGGGGGGGGVSESVIDLTGISTVTITVGSGGTGQNTSASNGRPGGTSSFGSYLSATGGDGGGCSAPHKLRNSDKQNWITFRDPILNDRNSLITFILKRTVNDV